ncbi:hypothetical protein BHE74_00036794 [Ensete ventricosum]|nr:hypothetical protein GW17_00018180 [Ensete ventricosum]RWW56484.1 hypothetical protein BHE74_00036794 [Ensete ventricosum]
MESRFDPETIEDLPPPPPIPPNVTPFKVDPEGSLPPKKSMKLSRVPMPRPGLGKKGQPVPLLTNHFKVSVRNIKEIEMHSFSLLRATGTGSPRGSDSPGESDYKRVRRPYRIKTFKVELNFAAKIPMKSIAIALKGYENENSQEALRVLDIILRQHAAKQYVVILDQTYH